MGKEFDSDGRVKKGPRQYWVDFLGRMQTKVSGVFSIITPTEQLDIVHAFKGSTWFKDVRARPDVPQPGEDDTLLQLGRVLGNQTTQQPRATSNINPMPTLLWSVPELAVLNSPEITTAAVVVFTATDTFAKTATLKAHPDNTDVIKVTFDGSDPTAGAAGVGWPMNAGDTQEIPVENLANVRLIADGGGQRAAILFIADQESWFSQPTV